MRATYRLLDVEDIQTTLTITATIADWRDIREKLETKSHPSWTFARMIDAITRKAEQAFNEEGESDGRG